MKGKLIRNLTANTSQLIINQLFGLVIFFVLSTNLDKNTFGYINLNLAILLVIFNILSFGIDQLVVKKIASGTDAKAVLSVYLIHVLLTGLLFYGILILINLLSPKQMELYKLLLFIGFGKLLVYFSTPFKQLAMGFERFSLLSYMLVTSNIVRGIALLVVALLHILTLNNVIMIFIAGDALELIVTIALFKYKLKIPFSSKLDYSHYSQLLKESFPQIGVVIITSALARFDWIFIGIILSAIKLAEYSFAYKLFELSTLPLLALAPLLIPRFTQIFKNKDIPVAGLKSLLQVEIVVAILIGLVLYLSWTPCVDLLTGSKYGAVNLNTILILSLCMPLLYINNFLWSIAFAQGRLRMIFGVIAFTFVVNVVCNLILIPVFKNEGAALAYLLAMFGQCLVYIRYNDVKLLDKLWKPLALCLPLGVVSALIAKSIFTNNYLIPLSAIVIYITVIILSKQFRFRDLKNITQLLS